MQESVLVSRNWESCAWVSSLSSNDCAESTHSGHGSDSLPLSFKMGGCTEFAFNTRIKLLVVSLLASFLLPQTECFQSSPFSQSDRIQLESVKLQGYMSFENTSSASLDWGRIRQLAPAGVVYPKSVADIVSIVQAVARSDSDLTVAARGFGHSVGGQAQAHNGIVIEMSTMRGIKVFPIGDLDIQVPFVEATGGELWVDVLEATLEHGLAPKSWTDYLYLTVGGTLSNAGVSGQAFRHGPEVSNILELEIVTGRGDLVVCSPAKNSELFFAVLGGLGQFGIITKARISLERAPQRVRWIRAAYTDFAQFTADQEALIVETSESPTFDYIEGFVVLNNDDRTNGWGSIPFVAGQLTQNLIPPEAGSVLYYLEVTKTYTVADLKTLDQVLQTLERMLAPLSFHPSLLFTTDVSYYKFLDRIHDVELALRSESLWDIPHPWLNIFVPAASIAKLDALVFKKLFTMDFSGPVLVYPLSRSKWDTRLSVAVPEGDTFYIVAFLRQKIPGSGPSLTSMQQDNEKILRICEAMDCKQYMPRYTEISQWKRHFGRKWQTFVQHKQMFDPRAILAPGQNIFSRTRRSSLIAPA